MKTPQVTGKSKSRLFEIQKKERSIGCQSFEFLSLEDYLSAKDYTALAVVEDDDPYLYQLNRNERP